MRVVGGSSSHRLAFAVARELGVPVTPVSFEKIQGGFPDGERYVRLTDDVRDRRVVLLQSTHPDGMVVELLLLQDALREGGAREVITFVPYFAYGRQDRVFEPGEALSARALARAVSAGSDRVLTLGLHNRETLKHFTCPVEDVSGMPAIARHFQGRVDVVVAPDDGAVRHAEEVASALGVPWDFLEKTRLDALTVKMTPKSLPVAGKRVGLVDEVISTGGTIAAAVKELRAQGAASVIAACLHGLFAGSALEKLQACDEVACADTLEGPMTKFSVASEIAAALRRL